MGRERARMIGRMVGGVLIHHRDGTQRRCFCPECVNQRATRASEKRQWKREARSALSPESNPEGQ